MFSCTIRVPLGGKACCGAERNFDKEESVTKEQAEQLAEEIRLQFPTHAVKVGDGWTEHGWFVAIFREPYVPDSKEILYIWRPYDWERALLAWRILGDA